MKIIRKTENFTRVSLFGWSLYITRGNQLLRKRKVKAGRSNRRHEAKVRRLAIAGYRCEVCGRTIDERCALHHRLPVGAEGRNAVENVLALCGECHRRMEAEPHVMGLQHLQDTTRYDGDAE